MKNAYVWSLILPATLLVACSDPASEEPSSDAGADTTLDSGPEADTDAGTDAEQDVAPDASPDTSPDAAVVDACGNIDAIRATCQALPDRFDASTTLAKGCYLASKTPVIGAGVTLTLAPGVTILFAQGTALRFSAEQALIAAGTEEEPICLTGDQAERGFWKGIELSRTEGADDKLDYVTIEYAGDTTSDAEAAAIKVVSDSRAVRLSLTNSTIRESEGYGLYLVASADLTAFANNAFTKNGLGPASVDSDVAGLLDDTSDYAGNDVDEIWVRTNRITKNGSWKSLGVPFHLKGNLNVDSPWTIDAPNTLIMAADAWIKVNGDVAALHAVGTDQDPIVFTGESPERGFWTGIEFNTTNHADNRLDYVTVEHAGSTDHDFNGAGVKAVADSHGVTLSLSNTTIHQSEGFGLFLTGSFTTPLFENNTFTDNTLGPASVGSEAVHLLDTGSAYTGNGVDHLRVRDGNVSKTVTWLDLGVPYELESYLNVSKVWTLAPGVTLLMPEDGWISMGGDEAGLHAVGTAQKPITISGIEKTAGYWNSIIFDTTLNGANALDYVTVEFGGATGFGENGLIHARSDSHGVALTVTNSTLRNSAQYAIYLGAWAQVNGDIESSNTFSNNALGNVLQEP
jgi:hypothetical protein